ncbi:MAG: hypothetical protein QXW97_02685 [Candidatus Pacearchaeota archaeon]
MKRKKAQIIGVVIFLIVIVLILLSAIITYIILKTNIISVNIKPTQKQKPFKTETLIEIQKKQDIVCYFPFVKIGDICCLDKNINRVCDNLEEQILREFKKEENVFCQRPYIQEGTRCCLDENYNKICDDYEFRYSNNNRYRTNIDDPFEIKEIDVSRKDLTLDIKNIGEEKVTITMIKVDECDKIKPNKSLDIGEKKSFFFDCDFTVKINSDIKIEYKIENSTELKIAEGYIKEKSDYRYLYKICDPYYDSHCF